MTVDMSTAVTIDTDTIIGLPELFSMLDAVDADIAEQTARLRHKQAFQGELRTAIQDRLKESGTRSITDDATGYKARIEQRTEWKVTDRDALIDYARQRPSLGLIETVEIVNEKAAITVAKGATLRVPGIAQVESERLVITPPKGGK